MQALPQGATVSIAKELAVCNQLAGQVLSSSAPPHPAEELKAGGLIATASKTFCSHRLSDLKDEDEDPRPSSDPVTSHSRPAESRPLSPLDKHQAQTALSPLGNKESEPVKQPCPALPQPCPADKDRLQSPQPCPHMLPSEEQSRPQQPSAAHSLPIRKEEDTHLAPVVSPPPSDEDGQQVPVGGPLPTVEGGQQAYMSTEEHKEQQLGQLPSPPATDAGADDGHHQMPSPTLPSGTDKVRRQHFGINSGETAASQLPNSADYSSAHTGVNAKSSV